MRGAGLGNTCPPTSVGYAISMLSRIQTACLGCCLSGKMIFPETSAFRRGSFAEITRACRILKYLCETTSPGLCNFLTVSAMAGTSEDCQRSTRRILGENILLVDDRLDGGVGTPGV